MAKLSVNDLAKRLVSSAKKAYFFFEDNYYALMDKVNGKVPVYKVIDPIDKLVPSMVLFVLVFVLLFAGVFVFVSLPKNVVTSFRVLDANSEALIGLQATIVVDENSLLFVSDNNGFFSVELKEKIAGSVSIEADGFEDFSQTVELDGTKQILILTKKPKKIVFTGPFSISVVDEDGNPINQDVSVRFSCSENPASAPASLTKNTGNFSVSTKEDCGELLASFLSDGFDQVSSFSISKPEITVPLRKSIEETRGKLNVVVTDVSDAPVPSATVALFDSAGVSVFESQTDETGKVGFEEIDPNDYNLVVSTDDGRQGNKAVRIDAGKTSTVSIVLKAAAESGKGKKILLKIVDSNSLQGISGVNIVVFSNKTVFKKDLTNSDGLVTVKVAPEEADKNFSAVLTHPSFVLKIVPSLLVVSESVSDAQQIVLNAVASDNSNYGNLKVFVVNEEGTAVANALINAFVSIFSTDYDNPLYPDPKVADSNGMVVFSNLQPGTYKAYARKPDFDEDYSQIITVDANKTTIVIVNLVIGRGQIRVIVKDSQSSPISNAKINFIDTVTGRIVDSNFTDAAGLLNSIPLKVARRFSVAVSADGFYPRASAPIMVVKNTLKDANLLLYRLNEVSSDKNISFKFLGLFKEDGTQGIVQAGQSYIAKFVLFFSQDKKYSDVTMHLRAGLDSQQTSSVSNAFVQNAFTAFFPILAFSKTLSSDIYSVSDSVPNDSNAKLVNVFWRDMNRGFVELNTKITVKQGLPDGSPVELHYSAKAKVADEDYFTQDNSQLFWVGKSACTENCDSSIGWVFEIQHDSDRHVVVPGTTEKLEKGYDYNLFYNIYNLTDSAFSSASLSVKNTDTSLLSFFGHETENSFSAFSAASIPAHSNYSYGMTSPLSITAKSETSFLDVNFVLSTTPKTKDGDDSNISTLTFSIKSTNLLTLELPKSLPQNPQGLTIIVKDQKTGTLLDNAFVYVSPDATVERRALKVFDKPGTYYIPFETGFMPERLALVKASVLGHKDSQKIVYVNGEAPDIISNYDYSCIKIDANSLKTDDQNTAFLLRGQNTNIVFKSTNCPYASNISLSVPSYLSDLVTITYSSGKSISLQKNDAVGVSVNVQVAQKSPIGKIPIFVDAKFSADVFPRRVKGVHLIVTDKTSCFAMLDRENFFGNQTIIETQKADFEQGTMQKIDSVSEDGNLLLTFEKGSKMANLGTFSNVAWFAVPGTDKVYVFAQNNSSSLKTFNCAGIKPESNIVAANGYFGAVGNNIVCSGYYNDNPASPTKLIRNQTFGVSYLSSIAVLVDTANNINFATIANNTIYQWRANSSAFKIISQVDGLTENSIVAASNSYFTTVGTDYSYSWNSNLIDNATTNPLRKYNTTGTKPGSKIASSGIFFATVSELDGGKLYAWDATADALTKMTATNVSTQSNIASSSNEFFLVVGDGTIYSWQKNTSSTLKSYYASGTSVVSNIVATDVFAVAAKDKAYGIVPASSLFRDYQTPSTLPSSGIALANEGYFSITGNSKVFSANLNVSETDSIKGRKEQNVPGISPTSKIVSGNDFFFAPGTNMVAIWQNNLQPRSLATVGTSVFSSVAFNNATAFAVTAKDKIFVVEKESFSNASVLPKQLLLTGMEIQATMLQANNYFMAASVGKSFSFKSDLSNNYFTTTDSVVSGYSVSGKYLTRNYSIAEPGNKSTVSNIQWKSNPTSGTTISAKYSLDNGANWFVVTNGQFVLKQSEKIMLSFDFATTDRLATPKIEEIKITYSTGASSSTDKFEYDISNTTDKGIIFNSCYGFVQDLQKPTMNIIAGIEPNAVSLRYSPAPKSPPVKLKEIYSFPSSCVEKEDGAIVECSASPTTAEDTFVSETIISDCPPNSTYHDYSTENFGSSTRLLDAAQRIILKKTVSVPGSNPPKTQTVDCMNYIFRNATLFKFTNILDAMPKNQKNVKLMLYSGKDSSLDHGIYLPFSAWGSATNWQTKPNAGTRLATLEYAGNGWWQADLTLTYNTWKEVPTTNQGVYIISTDSLSDLTSANFPTQAMDEFSFYSSENSDLEHRPKLVFGTAPEEDVDHKGIIDFNVSNRILVGEDNYALIEAVDHIIKNGATIASSEKFHTQLKAPVQQECVLPNNIFGKTGDSALPRIRFDWSWGANGLNEQYAFGECDQNNQDSVYCDSTQFSLLLLRKIDKIHSLALEAKYEQIAPYLHFNSYLIKDGYGIDFRKDFDYFMQNKNFNDTANLYLGDNGLWKYFSSDSLMTINSTNFDAQKVLDKPGLYRVDLSFDWSNESNKWVFFNGSTPIAKINITLTRISDPTINSPFYELPFDGKIGFSKRTDETTASRQYYGLGYTGQSIYLVNNPAGGSIVDTNNLSSSFATYAVSKGSNFKELNADAMRGILLSIDLVQKQIKFSPNSATPVLMQIDSNDANVPGYYSIFKETNPRTNEIEPFIFEKYGTVWSSIASNMNCQDFSNNGMFNNVPDKPSFAFNEECLNFEQSQGFKWFNIPTENLNKTLFLRTIFYSPDEEKYFLKRGCYDNTAFVSPNSIIATGPTESQITLDYTKSKFPIESIKALLDRVSSAGGQKVCISQDQNKINFWWNPQAINRELENKTVYGNTYDIGELITNDAWLCANTQ